MNISGKIKILLKGNWVELIIFIISLSLYVLTSSRSIVQGDTGEFLFVAVTGGVPHQPGYPLYSLISRIAFLLPLGNPAWQVTLLSAIFASLATVFTFKIIKTITNSIPSALFGALSLGTYQSFWFYALVAQIHILQVLLLSLLFYFLVLLSKTKNVKYLYLSSFIFGLGVSNNHSIIFTVPSLILAVIFFRKQITLKRLLINGFISLLGLLPYVYLVWVESLKPPLNWGGIYNLGSFLTFFFRTNYGTFNWSVQAPWAPFIYSPFIHFFVSIWGTSWYILPFLAASLFYLAKKNINYWLFFLGLIFMGPFFYLLMNNALRSVIDDANSEQYLSYPFFFISILAALGLNLILTKYKLRKTWLFSILVVLFFITPLVYNLPKVRLDNNQLTEVTTKFQLSELPENSILFAVGDNPYLPSMYWQYVMGYRKDITIVAFSLLSTSWYRDSLRLQHPELADILNSNSLNYSTLCEKYAAKGNLFISPWYTEFDVFFQDNCKIIPYGLVAKVVPANKVPNIQDIKDFNDEEWAKFTRLLPPLNTFSDQYSRGRETLFDLSEQHNYYGLYYLNENRPDWALKKFQEARKISPDETNSIVGESTLLYKNGKIAEVISILEDGIKRNPTTFQLYKNLAILYQKTNRPDKAYENFKKYLSFNPVDDTDVSNIKIFISSYENNVFFR